MLGGINRYRLSVELFGNVSYCDYWKSILKKYWLCAQIFISWWPRKYFFILSENWKWPSLCLVTGIWFTWGIMEYHAVNKSNTLKYSITIWGKHRWANKKRVYHQIHCEPVCGVGWVFTSQSTHSVWAEDWQVIDQSMWFSQLVVFSGCRIRNNFCFFHL